MDQLLLARKLCSPQAELNHLESWGFYDTKDLTTTLETSIIHQFTKNFKLRQGTVAHTSTLGGQGRRIMRSGLRDQPNQNGETPSLLKIHKFAGHNGACLYSQLLRRLRPDNFLNLGSEGSGEPRSRHCTSSWATRANLHLKQTNKQKETGLVQLRNWSLN